MCFIGGHQCTSWHSPSVTPDHETVSGTGLRHVMCWQLTLLSSDELSQISSSECPPFLLCSYTRFCFSIVSSFFIFPPSSSFFFLGGVKEVGKGLVILHHFLLYYCPIGKIEKLIIVACEDVIKGASQTSGSSINYLYGSVIQHSFSIYTPDTAVHTLRP